MGFLTSEVRQCQLLVTHLPLATVSGREMAWEHIAVLFAGCDIAFDLRGVAVSYLRQLSLFGLSSTPLGRRQK